MALLEWGGKRVPVATGELVLGSDADCALQLTGSGVQPRHAVIRGMPDGQVVIRKAVPQAEVVINGVRLGAEPTPLLHGDKVEIGGDELTFVDERRSGSTQYIQAMQLPQGVQAAAEAARAPRPTGNTGGRVVSLTDGREYAVAGSSLVFGREAGCDVVVTGKDVSRRHAEIVSTPQGYMLVDTSTNGTQVNGERVQGQRLLARADVIAIGEETFRFYADTIAAAPPPPSPPPSGAPQLQHTVMGPTTPARPSAAVNFASFLARSGALKGQRFAVKAPVVNIGRADYNDIVVRDESVSTAHAKLQRREGVWVLVDLDSTNGTFVDDERVQGEAPLPPGATVRLGDVVLVFEPTDDAVGVQKGGGTRLLEVMKPAAPPAAPPAPAPASKPPAAAKPAAAKPAAAKPAAPPRREPARRPAATAAQEKKKGKGCGASVVVFALGATAFLYWLLA
jgi:pSer/pThr/pTyr-binding forkhead associated (FHA) protein